MQEGGADILTAADETQKRILYWKKAEKAVLGADYALRRAESERTQMRKAVIDWLIPTNTGSIKAGDKFSVWVGDSLYTLTVQQSGDCEITETKRVQKA